MRQLPRVSSRLSGAISITRFGWGNRGGVHFLIQLGPRPPPPITLPLPPPYPCPLAMTVSTSEHNVTAYSRCNSCDMQLSRVSSCLHKLRKLGFSSKCQGNVSLICNVFVWAVLLCMCSTTGGIATIRASAITVRISQFRPTTRTLVGKGLARHRVPGKAL